MIIEHREEDVYWIFEEMVNHNLRFSEFSKTQITLKVAIQPLKVSLSFCLFCTVDSIEKVFTFNLLTLKVRMILLCFG